MAGAKVAADLARTTGARPFGYVEGARPLRHPDGQGRKVEYSGRPYVQAYEDRPLCTSLRTDGNPCKAKAMPDKAVCNSHDQG